MCFYRIDQIAGQQQLLRTIDVDEERPDDGAAVARDQSDLYVRIANPCVLSHVDDIAEQGDCRADSDGVAVYSADNRLFDGKYRVRKAPRTVHYTLCVASFRLLHFGKV